MKATAEKIDNHKVVLQMEVPQAEVAKAIDRACQKVASKVNIPGFRKGKVPRKILEMRLGKEALLDEAFEIIAPGAYAEALKEHNIDPVSRPEIEVVTLAEDKPLVFKATVTAKPEVTLGEYKDITVKKQPVEITADDVNQQIDTLRERHAKMVVVENAALQDGDFAIIDFDGSIDGVPFKGGEAKGYPLQLGSGSFIPGFEDQLIGAKAGDERDVTVAFPADYHAEELAGKEAVFKVKVNDVKRKEMPEVDDEFAKEASDVETVEELKANIENTLKQSAEEAAEKEFRTNAVKAAVNNASVEIPAVMVEQKIDTMLQDLDVNLQNQGANLEKYMEYLKTDVNALRENYREMAQEAVKTELVMDAIIKAEGIEVTADDLDAEMAVMAATYKVPVDQVRKVILQDGRLESLAQTVVRRKAMKLILDSAKAE